jgi:hypothetical protein
MKALVIESTEKTPSVILDPENDHFEISGKSIPKDAESFYAPILEWLEFYAQNPRETTNIMLNLEFFNIASSKRLLFVLYKLNELIDKNYKVAIKWCYKHDDDDMLEVGQDYAFMVKIPFEFEACKPELVLEY